MSLHFAHPLAEMFCLFKHSIGLSVQYLADPALYRDWQYRITGNTLKTSQINNKK